MGNWKKCDGVYFLYVERSFREQLCVMETQLMSLQSSCEELGAHRKSGEKRERENVKLKSIISSQDERVRKGLNTILTPSLLV